MAAYRDASVEDAELVGPGGEAAAPLEGVQLAQHGDQRVVGGLLGQVLEISGAGSGQEVAQPPDVVSGRP